MTRPSSDASLTVQTKAVAASARALRVARRIRPPYRCLADQLIRSAASVAANIAEGHGRLGRDRRHHYRIAYGSAKEASVHLELLAAGGVLTSGDTAPLLAAFDEVRAMLWRLMNPKG